MKKTFRKSVQDLLSVRAGRLVNLAGVFLVAGTLSLSASTYATEHMLSLNLKNATIREAIESIKSQSEFSSLRQLHAELEREKASFTRQ